MGRQHKYWLVAHILVAMACGSVHAVSFTNRADLAYSAQAGTNLTWIHKALTERALAVGLAGPDTNNQSFQVLKDKCKELIPHYVDPLCASGGTFSTYFATADTNGGYTSDVPMLTITGILVRLHMPTNYFDYTPDVCMIGNTNIIGTDTDYSTLVVSGFGLTFYSENINGTYMNVREQYSLNYDLYENVDYDYFRIWKVDDATWTIGNNGNDPQYESESGLFGTWVSVGDWGCDPIGSLSWGCDTNLPPGTNYPPGRTNWTTRDYGGEGLTNILRQMVYTRLDTAWDTSYSSNAGIYYGQAYGYDPTNALDPRVTSNEDTCVAQTQIPVVEILDGIKYVSWSCPYARKPDSSTISQYLFRKSSTNVALYAYQETAHLTMTNVGSAGTWATNSMITGGISNSRSGWYHLIQVSASGVTTNPNTYTIYSGTPPNPYNYDFTNTAIGLEGTPATNVYDHAKPTLAWFWGSYYVAKSPHDSPCVDPEWGGAPPTDFSFTSNGVAINPANGATDIVRVRHWGEWTYWNGGTTLYLIYDYSGKLTSVSVHHKDPLIKKYRACARAKVSSVPTDCASERQLYLWGYMPTTALEVTNRVWDPPAGSSLTTNRYALEFSETTSATDSSYTALGTNYAAPFPNCHDDWRGWAVSSGLWILRWDVTNGFQYK